MQPPGMVAAQIAAVCGYFPVAAVKIGMTFSAGIIEAIVGALDVHARNVPVVLDPVMCSSSGTSLLEPGGEEALVRVLLPRATVVTPNMAEAAVLAGVDGVSDVSTMEQAARRIAERSHCAVVVKGGHLENSATAEPGVRRNLHAKARGVRSVVRGKLPRLSGTT